jgi:hypothetical protein
MEVLALKVPFGNISFPNEVPWPGRLRAFTPSKILDAGRRRELQKIRPASHTSALGELFIADDRGGAQEAVYEVGSGVAVPARCRNGSELHAVGVHAYHNGI